MRITNPKSSPVCPLQPLVMAHQQLLAMMMGTIHKHYIKTRTRTELGPSLE